MLKRIKLRIKGIKNYMKFTNEMSFTLLRRETTFTLNGQIFEEVISTIKNHPEISKNEEFLKELDKFNLFSYDSEQSLDLFNFAAIDIFTGRITFGVKMNKFTKEEKMAILLHEIGHLYSMYNKESKYYNLLEKGIKKIQKVSRKDSLNFEREADSFVYTYFCDYTKYLSDALDKIIDEDHDVLRYEKLINVKDIEKRINFLDITNELIGGINL